MSVIQARAFFPTTGTAGNKPQKGEIRRETPILRWPFPTYGELLFA